VAPNTRKYRYPVRVLRLLVFCVSTFLLFQFVSLYLSWQKQTVLGGVSLLIALVLTRVSRSRLITLALMLLSIAATLRYGCWRLHMVYDFFTDQSNSRRLSLDAVLMLVLLSAEIYTTCIMILGYMQAGRPLQAGPFPCRRTRPNGLTSTSSSPPTTSPSR
jgi:cellulose synthase (UDP-forming)